MQPYTTLLNYVRLQTRARAALSDRCTITEEFSILNFLALNLREVHEGPEGFKDASVTVASLDVERVLQRLDILAQHPRTAGGAAHGQGLRARQRLGQGAANHPGLHGLRDPARMPPIGRAAAVAATCRGSLG